MDALPYAVFSGVLSGIVSSLASIGIERFGGNIGGILGSSPSTLIAACIGLWLTLTSQITQQSIVQYQKAMLIIAPGMIVNCLFLYCWKIIPKAYAKYSERLNTSTVLLVTAISITTCTVWFVGASFVVLMAQSITPKMTVSGEPISATYLLTSSQVPMFYFAVIAFTIHCVIGLSGTWNFVATPRSTAKVSLYSNVLRGVVAGLSIFCAVLLGKVDPVIGGIASLFPAIFGTAMVSVWLTSGSAVSLGAVEPLMLGSLSVSFFAILIAFIMPAIYLTKLPGIAAMFISIIVAYIASIIFVSWPAYLFIIWRGLVSVERSTAVEIDSELIQNNPSKA